MLTVTLFLAALASAAAAAGLGSAEPERLQLREQVTCSGPEYRLGELLLACPDVDLAQRVVGGSPAPGASRRLSRNRLERILASWGWRGRLVGPESLLLCSPGLELDSAALRERVTARLDSLLAARGLTRLGEAEGWPRQLILSVARLRWELVLTDGKPQRNAVARLEVTDAAGFQARFTLRYRCARMAMVPAAADALRPGDTIAAWDLQERDLFRLDGQHLSPPEMKGAVARRSIKPGEVLTRRNMKPAVLVNSGREVEIRLIRGAVAVSLKGIAQADGALGDVISVRHLDTRILRRYRVTAAGTVAPPYLNGRGESS